MHVQADVDVRKIQKRLKLSQAEFAAEFGLSASTIRDWEQNRRRPRAPRLCCSMFIKKEPDAVRRALASALR